MRLTPRIKIEGHKERLYVGGWLQRLCGIEPAPCLWIACLTYAYEENLCSRSRNAFSSLEA